MIDIKKFFTPTDEAVLEIMKRRTDLPLKNHVEDYLCGDIPEHFNGKDPILYFSRHVASPNFETIRYIELSNPYDKPIIIGQDTNDKFVSNNCLKKALGKLSVLKGSSHNGDEIIENFTILNFNENLGKKLCDVKICNGTSLIDFHTKLFRRVCGYEVELIDESVWIDRNHRGDLRAYYEKLLALLITHGIMFEFYEEDDEEEEEFIMNIFEPAFKKVEKIFGCKPLICEVLTPEMDAEREWLAYPDTIYPLINELLKTN